MKENRRNTWLTVSYLLFAAGFLCMLVAIALRDPTAALIVAAAGLLAMMPVVLPVLLLCIKEKKPRRRGRALALLLLDVAMAVGGISFYFLLLGMKVLGAYGVYLPNWLAAVWLGMLGLALAAAGAKDLLKKKIPAEQAKTAENRELRGTSVLPKTPEPWQMSVEQIQKKLEDIFGKLGPECGITWNFAEGYILWHQPERSPRRTVLFSETHGGFLREAMLWLVVRNPEKLSEVSDRMIPLAENRWAGRAEHGYETLYLEKRKNQEYLLWYRTRDFDTQTECKLVNERTDFRVISVSTRKEYTAEEFLEGAGLKKSWSSWAVRTLMASRRFLEVFRMEQIQALDYPVLFTSMEIYPNRLAGVSAAMQVLHDRSSASYGTKYHDKVYLLEGGDLVCERSARSEYGPREDRESMIRATTAVKVKKEYEIPLTEWILSLDVGKLRALASRVRVQVNDDRVWDSGRTVVLKRETFGDKCERTGWSSAHDEIFLSFESHGSIFLCREGWWRKVPDGLPYHIRIEANLLPGMEKEPKEVLIKAIESLPFGDPNEAERQMQNFRRWLDPEALRREEAFYAGQAQANSMSYASAALEQVQTQLRRLKETV